MARKEKEVVYSSEDHYTKDGERIVYRDRESQKKKRNPFLLGCLGLLGLLILLGACGAIMGMGDDKTETTKEDKTEEVTTESKDTKEDTTTEKATTEEKKEQSFKMGDEVNLKDVLFRINKISDSKEVGTALTKKANGQFLIVDASVKNNRKDALMVSSSFFTLKVNDTEYKSDATASTYANQAVAPDNLGFFSQEINPGIQKDAFVVFDVPAEVISSDDKIMIVQTGVFGTEKAEISLK